LDGDGASLTRSLARRIYYTDYTRSITEKLTSKEDAFSDPSQSSIACTASPSAAFTAGDPSAVSGKEGKEIFAELKALNPFQNKQTRWVIASSSCARSSRSATLRSPVLGDSTLTRARRLYAHSRHAPSFASIRRIYNPDTNDVVYVAYNTRNTRSADEGGVSSSRYRTSMCSVHISN
jgi:catabolite regulation protein CreA